MTTRREFSGKLLSAVAAGTLANYALVAEAAPRTFEERLGDKCNDNGKSDQCHGNGNKSDTDQPPQPEPPTPPEPPVCKAPAPDAEPVCEADTCSQADAPTGNE